MEQQDLDNLMKCFTPVSAWSCNTCGELVGTEADDMEEHMETHNV